MSDAPPFNPIEYVSAPDSVTGPQNNNPRPLVSSRELAALGATAGETVQEQITTRFTSVNAADIEFLPGNTLTSQESNALSLYYNRFTAK